MIIACAKTKHFGIFHETSNNDYLRHKVEVRYHQDAKDLLGTVMGKNEYDAESPNFTAQFFVRNVVVVGYREYSELFTWLFRTAEEAVKAFKDLFEAVQGAEVEITSKDEQKRRDNDAIARQNRDLELLTVQKPQTLYTDKPAGSAVTREQEEKLKYNNYKDDLPY